MLPTSIRWRLPFSYAAVALLATVALGAILLLTLRTHYQRQERDYLTNNARAIGAEVAPSIQGDLPPGALLSQLKGFAFLTQTRVRLLDTAGRVLGDSSSAQAGESVATISLQVEVGSVSQAFSRTVSADSPTITYQSTIVVEDSRTPRRIVTTDEITGQFENVPAEAQLEETARLPAVSTPYGFGLGANAAAGHLRSPQVVRQPVYSPLQHELLGYVELSEGPAYGQAVLTNVAWSWATASSVAVLVAALAGWAISRQLALPLLALTGVTAHMAAGDLSARATVDRHDELGALGRAFNQMAGRIEETVSTLRRFVADAAHELHTPLAVLQANLELMTSQPLETQQAARAARAQAQVQRLIALTDSLLDLSQIEAGPVAEYVAVDLCALVQTSSELFASRAEQVGVAFTLALPDVAVIVAGSKQQLRQAIENLLDNAVKFTPAGGSIQVQVAQSEGWATVVVSNKGIGIAEEEWQHLFHRFHRGKNAAAYPGSGLGLALVKAIGERHGGRIYGAEQDGETRFWLKLPVA